MPPYSPYVPKCKIRSVGLGSKKSIFSRQFSNWILRYCDLWSTNSRRKVFYCTLGTIRLSFSPLRRMNCNLFEFSFSILFVHCHQKFIIYYRCLRTAVHYLHIWQLTFFLSFFKTLNVLHLWPFSCTFNCSKISILWQLQTNCVGERGSIERQTVSPAIGSRQYNIVRQKGNHFLINIPLP